MTSNVFAYLILIAPRKNVRFTTKRVEQRSTLTANLKNTDLSRKVLVPMYTVALVLMVMEALDMIVLTVMVVLVQHFNTNASEHQKPSAILPLAQYHPSIVRREKRKFVKS